MIDILLEWTTKSATFSEILDILEMCLSILVRRIMFCVCVFNIDVQSWKSWRYDLFNILCVLGLIKNMASNISWLDYFCKPGSWKSVSNLKHCKMYVFIFKIWLLRPNHYDQQTRIEILRRLAVATSMRGVSGW